MRDIKRRARQWIAEVTKTKTRSTGSTRQKTAVPKPPSQVLYILPLWEKPSDMERVAVDCLIKAKDVRKGATELGVHRKTLTDAMGLMRCAALLVTQCERAPRIQQDATRKRKSAGEAGLDPRGHLWVTWGMYLCAGKPPLADIILSHPLT